MNIFQEFKRAEKIRLAFYRKEEDSIEFNEYLIYLINLNLSYLNQIPISYNLEYYNEFKYYLEKLKVRLIDEKHEEFLDSIINIFKLSVNELVIRDAGRFLSEELEKETDLDLLIIKWKERIKEY